MTGLLFSQDQKYLITMTDKGEIRLWRHENWTMVDLLATLATGVTSEILLSMTDSNHLMIETKTDFSEYAFDFNGFVLIGKSAKSFPTHPSSNLLLKDTYFSGDQDGSIRSYALIDG